jgi:hypothetical protein
MRWFNASVPIRMLRIGTSSSYSGSGRTGRWMGGVVLVGTRNLSQDRKTRSRAARWPGLSLRWVQRAELGVGQDGL